MTRFLLVGIAAIGLAAPVRAETPDIKLGLWETTAVMSGLGPLDNGPQVSRSCLTKPDLEKFMGNQPQSDGCKQTVAASTPALHVVKMECPSESMQSEMRLELRSPKLVTGTLSATVAGDGGQTQTMTSKITSKWLSTDCGDVK